MVKLTKLRITSRSGVYVIVIPIQLIKYGVLFKNSIYNLIFSEGLTLKDMRMKKKSGSYAITLSIILIHNGVLDIHKTYDITFEEQKNGGQNDRNTLGK